MQSANRLCLTPSRVMLAGLVALGTASAQTPPAIDSGTSSQGTTLDEVLVIGKGATRETQTLTREQFDQAAPGANPLEVLGQLPGVSFHSTDPLALDPYSANVYMRGFTEDQLGFTLDGVPLGAQGYGSSGQGYGNIGGININSAIISDNIARVNVSQLDPTEQADATVSQAFGTHHAFRTFARINSGSLNESGTRFFVSYGRTDEDKWKGAGSMFQEQVNAKLLQPLEGHGTLTAFFDWDHEAEATYSDLSKNILSILGPDVDYYYPNYSAAYHAAEGVYPPGYVKLDLSLGEAADWSTTVYLHHKQFAGYYTSPYYPSPDGAPALRRGVCQLLGARGYELRSYFPLAATHAQWRHMVRALACLRAGEPLQ